MFRPRVLSALKIAENQPEIQQISSLWRAVSQVDIVRAGRLNVTYPSSTTTTTPQPLFASATLTMDSHDLDEDKKILKEQQLHFLPAAGGGGDAPSFEAGFFENTTIIDAGVSRFRSPSGNVLVSVFKLEGGSTRFDISNGHNGVKSSIHKVPAAPLKDPLLQHISWSRDESKFVFIGEKKRPKATKPWEITGDTKESDRELAEKRSSWETPDSWGEVLKDNSIFTLFACYLHESKVVDMIDNDFSNEVSCVGPSLISVPSGGDKKGEDGDEEETVILSGLSHGARRLGLVFCRNRPTSTFKVPLPSKPPAKGKVPTLLPMLQSFRGICNARVSSDHSQIAFLALSQHGVSPSQEIYPHFSGVTLHVAKTADVLALTANEEQSKRFVESTQIISDVLETPQNPDEGFHGIYPFTGNDLWWTLDDNALLVVTIVRGSQKVFLVPTTSKPEENAANLLPLPVCRTARGQHGTWTVLDVTGNHALLVHSALTQGQEVCVVSLSENQQQYSIQPSTLIRLGTSFPFETLIEPHYDVQTLRLREQHDTEATYFRWKDDDEGDNKKPRPTLFVIHGGPHAADTCGFNYGPLFMLLNGWDMVSINYGGSIGFGQHRVIELLGQIGTNDVADCMAVVKLLESKGLIDTDRLVLSGGSHGGFLTGHLSGQFPSVFKATIIRNPVMNMGAMYYETDIPDWILSESGYDDSEEAQKKRAADDKVVAGVDPVKLMNMSPIAHASKVTAATIIGIGLDDKRVPPPQGRTWYHALKTSPQQPPVRMMEYEKNGHALDGVHASADFNIHAMLYLRKHVPAADAAQ